jgi:ribonuclease HI
MEVSLDTIKGYLLKEKQILKIKMTNYEVVFSNHRVPIHSKRDYDKVKVLIKNRKMSYARESLEKAIKKRDTLGKNIEIFEKFLTRHTPKHIETNTLYPQKTEESSEGIQSCTVVYTDGGARPSNPGPGGWGVVILDKNNTPTCHSGGSKWATNNQMEMTAAIEALKRTTGPIRIMSDSMYVVNCASGKWQRKKNVELWSVYDGVAKGRGIELEWVKAHNNNKYNDMADELATQQALKMRNSYN